MKKVCITGGNGFVGSHLIEYIVKEHPEYEIIAMKRSQTSSMKNVEHIKSNKLRWVICDFTDSHSVNTLFKENKFDKIFHLGAQSFVPASFNYPNKTITTNMISTINILEAVKEFNKDSIIHIASSSEVYGEHDSDLKKETEQLHPLSPYGVSKVGQDLLGFIYYKMYGLKTVISRAYTHSGPRRGQMFFESAFARQIANIEKGLQEPIIRVGNLNSKRTIADVRDVVRMYWHLTEKGKWGESYNCAGKEYWLVSEVLEYLISLSSMKDKIKVEVDPSLLRPTDITLQNPDLNKFESLGDFEYRYDVKTMLSDLLQYWREEI